MFSDLPDIHIVHHLQRWNNVTVPYDHPSIVNLLHFTHRQEVLPLKSLGRHIVALKKNNKSQPNGH